MGTCIKLPHTVEILSESSDTTELDENRGGKTNKRRPMRSKKRHSAI